MAILFKKEKEKMLLQIRLNLLQLQTEEVSIERLEAYKKDNSEFMHVSSVDARLHIVCDEATEDDLSVVFYDLLRIGV